MRTAGRENSGTGAKRYLFVEPFTWGYGTLGFDLQTREPHCENGNEISRAPGNDRHNQPLAWELLTLRLAVRAGKDPPGTGLHCLALSPLGPSTSHPSSSGWNLPGVARKREQERDYKWIPGRGWGMWSCQCGEEGGKGRREGGGREEGNSRLH